MFYRMRRRFSYSDTQEGDMMINDLVWQRQSTAGEPRTDRSYNVCVPIYHAAQVEALAGMFTGLTPERIITDRTACGLDELTSSFGYEPGEEMAADDEKYDPMVADIGLTSRFQALPRTHAQRLSGDQ